MPHKAANNIKGKIMSKLNSGGPAFPVYMVVGDIDPAQVVDAINQAGASGVSLKAYLMANATPLWAEGKSTRFAEQLTGEAAPQFGKPECFEWMARAEAKWRAMQAEAMMAELQKETP